MTASCPVCFGDGSHDMRDMNALLREHLTDQQLIQLDAALWEDSPECTVCEGSGFVTEELAEAILNESRALVLKAVSLLDSLEDES